MELTEKERLMLESRRQELQKLTNHAIEIVNRKISDDAKVELKKCVTNMLSIIGNFGDYTDSRNFNLNAFKDMANSIFNSCLYATDFWGATRPMVEVFCNYANSIQLNFTKKTFKINIRKIDLSLFKISHDK